MLNKENYRAYSFLTNNQFAFYSTHHQKFHEVLVRLGTINMLIKNNIITLEAILSLNETQSKQLYEAALRSETTLVELLASNPIFSSVKMNRNIKLNCSGYEEYNLNQVQEFLNEASEPAKHLAHYYHGRVAIKAGLTLDELASLPEEAASSLHDNIKHFSLESLVQTLKTNIKRFEEFFEQFIESFQKTIESMICEEKMLLAVEGSELSKPFPAA